MNKRILTPVLAGALVLAAVGAQAAALTTGNVVLNLVGDGTTSLSGAGAAVNFLEFTPSSLVGGNVSPLQTITVATTGADAITQAGSSTSEGGVAGIAGGNGLVFVGYGAAAGTANVTTATGVTRRVATLNYSTGTVSYTDIGTTYSGSAIRFASAYPNGDGQPGSAFVAAGSGPGSSQGGIRTGTFGSATTNQISGTLTNTRVASAYEGQIYFTSQSGAATGLNVATGTGFTNLFTETNASPYDFQFFSGSVVYVADDRATNLGGVQKWINTGGTWTKAYTVNLPNAAAFAGARQIAVTPTDASGNSTFYVVGTNNQLYSFSDNVLATTTSFGGTATSIYTAGTNFGLRGVEVVPEPASMAILGLGLVGLAARRRRSAK